MITDKDKAYVAGLITIIIVGLLTQNGIMIPIEVEGALRVLIDWGLPVLFGLVTGFLVYLTPNKLPTAPAPPEESILPYRESPRK